MDHHKSGQWAPQAQATSAEGASFWGDLGACSQKTLKIGSLKTPFSALSGRNMWQNGTDNFIIFHKITLNIPFKLFYFGLWLLCSSVAFQNRDILRPDWGWVGIRDSQSKLGLSRLNRDGWTLCEWLASMFLLYSSLLALIFLTFTWSILFWY